MRAARPGSSREPGSLSRTASWTSSMRRPRAHAITAATLEHLPAVGELARDRRRVRMRCISSRSSAENISGRYSRFSMPTPCSPVIEPPSETHSRRIVAGQLVRALERSRLAAVERISGCRFPSPAWKTLATRMPRSRSSGRSRPAPRRAACGARRRPGRCSPATSQPTAENALLRPFQISARSLGSSVEWTSVAPDSASSSSSATRSASTTSRSPFELDDQERRARRVTAASPTPRRPPSRARP